MTRRADKSRATAAIALAVAAMLATLPLRGAELVDRVIAVVSGTVLMLSDARAAISFGLVDTTGARDPIEAAMRWLIDRQLVLDEANRSEDSDVDPDLLGARLSGIRRRFASEDDYRAALARVGLNDEHVRELVSGTLLAEQYATRRFETVPSATDEELRDFYDRHPDRFVRSGRRLTFDQAASDVRAAVEQQRRQQAESAWMDRLRRRADINEIYQSPR